MAEGAKIYTKTIDPSVQDGIDNNLIIQPNYAYQKKFNFGSDWTEIKMGLFLSYTNSVTNDNLGFSSSGVLINSGNTTPDTSTWFGLIEDKPSKFIPTGTNSGVFWGTKFHLLQTFQTFSSSSSLILSGYHDWNYFQRHITTNNNGSTISAVSADGKDNPLPSDTDDTTFFAGYIGRKYRIIDKGLPTQRLETKIYKAEKDGNFVTDISLLNLKDLINGNDKYQAGEVEVQDANSAGVATNIPDSFFFYNAFLTIRPRIHAIAVKKIS